MTANEIEAEIREQLEWDWAYTLGPGNRLHHLAEIEYVTDWWQNRSGVGWSACGVRTEYAVPGMLSRMGMERCAHCCDRLGIPRGTGSPKNDPALRPWVEARLA